MYGTPLGFVAIDRCIERSECFGNDRPIVREEDTDIDAMRSWTVLPTTRSRRGSIDGLENELDEMF